MPLTLGMPDFSVYTIVQKTQAQNNITERNVKVHDDVQCVTTFSLIQNPQTKESSINAKKITFVQHEQKTSSETPIPKFT